MIVVKIVVCKRVRLAILAQICLLLVACGNKGDLYLEQVELTEEQKTLLNELDIQDSAEPALESDKNTKKKSQAQSENDKPSS